MTTYPSQPRAAYALGIQDGEARGLRSAAAEAVGYDIEEARVG